MMELELANAWKPVRQLRRSLKRLPAEDPPIKDVHELRTRARRLEAIVFALEPVNKRHRQLLKTLKPVSKAAGKVRDMDVLTAKARALAGHRHDRSLARLLGHLRTVRIESARKLVETVDAQRGKARTSLKHFTCQIKKCFEAKKGFQANDLERSPAGKMMDELRRWPALNEENLHAYRIKIKELLFVLHLTEGLDLTFVEALERVKEEIGNWHDWQELRRIACDVLDTTRDRALLKEIDEMRKEEYDRALTAAYALKKRYLGAHSGIVFAEP
jgi:CHAD domain-containing protein